MSFKKRNSLKKIEIMFNFFYSFIHKNLDINSNNFQISGISNFKLKKNKAVRFDFD